MLKFGLANLRRLKAVNPIELRPITLLVGRNSGGKSSFLRTLPLFRQSLMTRTSSPILWYGDLVDFGSFENSVTNHDENTPIDFYFDIDEVSLDVIRYYPRLSQEDVTSVKNLSYKVSITGRSKKTFTNALELRFGDLRHCVRIEINENQEVVSLVVDEINVLPMLEKIQFYVPQGSVFPEIRIINKITKEHVSPIYWQQIDAMYFVDSVVRYLRPYIDGRVTDKSIARVIEAIILEGIPNKTTLARQFRASKPSGLRKFFEMILRDENGQVFRNFLRLIITAHVTSITQATSSYLRSILSNTLYIGPMRAQSERYYRYQDLAVSEIDPDGKNFAMFLNSLSQSQKMSFSRWVDSLFNYGVVVKEEAGHISINLVEGTVQTNLVDVGYGVSQILPVLGQIWWARERRNLPRRVMERSKISLLAIEQPELHLHPAHQALLADALAGEANWATEGGDDQNLRTHYVIETHSETLVNRLGALISVGKIKSSDVQIVLFEPNETDPGLSDVRSVLFDDQGSLVDWPYGFFQASPVI